MFLLFYISLQKALNLQELFMIFQRRQRFLTNFALIKRNSINEIKKKCGDDSYIIYSRTFSILFLLLLLYSCLFLIVPIESHVILLYNDQKKYKMDIQKIKWLDEEIGSRNIKSNSDITLNRVVFVGTLLTNNNHGIKLAYSIDLYWLNNSDLFSYFSLSTPFCIYVDYLCSANPTPVLIFLFKLNLFLFSPLYSFHNIYIDNSVSNKYNLIVYKSIYLRRIGLVFDFTSFNWWVRWIRCDTRSKSFLSEKKRKRKRWSINFDIYIYFLISCIFIWSFHFYVQFKIDAMKIFSLFYYS